MKTLSPVRDHYGLRSYEDQPVVLVGFQRGPASPGWTPAWNPFEHGGPGVELPLWLISERIFGGDPNEKVGRSKAFYRTVRYALWKFCFSVWALWARNVGGRKSIVFLLHKGPARSCSAAITRRYLSLVKVCDRLGLDSSLLVEGFATQDATVPTLLQENGLQRFVINRDDWLESLAARKDLRVISQPPVRRLDAATVSRFRTLANTVGSWLL